MDIEFDPAKSDRNASERGFDFPFAARIFDGRTLEFADTRHDYGELRVIALGIIDGRVYKVVFSDRDGVRRIISAHKASRQEIRKWQTSE